VGFLLAFALPKYHGPLAAVAKSVGLSAVALLGLLALTIAASYINLGALNSIVSAAISVASTALILLFYMHVRRIKPLLWAFVGAGFFWLGIMFALAFSDFLTRGWR
jgi:cytochrome c oxidase subunit 4